jgi:hypothetical protein
MFKIKNLPIVALVLFLFFACKQRGLLTYGPPDTIFFQDSASGIFTDTAMLTFAYSDPTVTDTSFGIFVFATGGPVGYDRVFSIAVDPASSAVAGQEYVLPDSCVFHANHVKDTLSIKFLRAAVLKDSTFHLILNLKSNQNFQVNLPFTYDIFGDTVSATTFTVGVNDILTDGPYWSIFQTYFGAFSVKKVELMNQIVGLPLNFWISDNLQTSSAAIVYAINFTKYLNAQAAAGDTVYDSPGVPMVMGTGF